MKFSLVLKIVIVANAVLYLIWLFLKPIKRGQTSDSMEEEFQRNAATWRTDEAHKWTIDFIRFYRNLDFFAAQKGLSDEALADQILEFINWEFSSAFNPYDKEMELMILSYDKDRVWFYDTECVVEGNDEYAGALQEWAKISRGAFLPTDVSEKWDSENGPIRIKFKLNNSMHEFIPALNDDWFDMTILDRLNSLIGHTEYSFVVAYMGQAALVVALTDQERKTIEKERGCKFS